MALDTFALIDHGAQLLGWSTGTPEGQQRMAADLRLLAELQELTAAEAALSTCGALNGSGSDQLRR